MGRIVEGEVEAGAWGPDTEARIDARIDDSVSAATFTRVDSAVDLRVWDGVGWHVWKVISGD